MTRKPNKQSSSLYSLLAPAFLIFVFLIGCFFYALCYEERFFLFIAGALFVAILLLFPLRYRLERKRALRALEREEHVEQVNVLTSEIEKEKEVLESIQEKIIKYSQLKGLTEQLSLCPSLEETAQTLTKEINILMGKKSVTTILYLFQSPGGELGIASSQTEDKKGNIKSKQGDAFDQWVVKTMQPLFVEDTKNDYRFDMDKIDSKESRDVRSLISVPLIIGRKALGILRVDSPENGHFLTEDLRFLNTIGGLGGIAIENAKLYERLKSLAIKDGLTGLYLRRYLLERFDVEISRELRRKKELSFLMMDLDNFKKYNDKFGHVAGDIVLKTLASILAETFKDPGDLVARYGGEEFSVLLPDCSKEKAVELAGQLREKISNEIITLRREKTKITVSVGVATFPEDGQSKDELINSADQALYQAKAKGRNRVCVA